VVGKTYGEDGVVVVTERFPYCNGAIATALRLPWDGKCALVPARSLGCFVLSVT
jgi:hypothetical protein